MLAFFRAEERSTVRAGFGRATGSLPIRRRPLAGIFEADVVSLLEASPHIRPVAVFEELMRRPGEPLSRVAIAIEARRSGRPVPEELVAFPTQQDGIRGMRFIDDAVQSARTRAWLDSN